MNRWPWLAALCLAVLGLGAVCARVDVPKPVSPPATPPPVALPLGSLPAVSLPPPASARPAGRLSPEAARVKTPSWARLEEVWGTTDNLRHPGVTAGAFTADGKTVVTLGNRGHLRVWDLATRVLRAELDACVPARTPGTPWPSAHALVISPDGLVAMGFGAGRICVADLATGKLIRNIEAHAAFVVGLAFAGGLLVSYGYQAFVGEATPGGYIAAQEEAGGEVRWWNPRTGARVAEVVVGPQQAIGFFPDGNQLVTVGKALAVWQRNGRKNWHHTADVSALAVLPGDRLLVAARAGGLAVLSAETGQSGATFETAAGRNREVQGPRGDGRRAFGRHAHRQRRVARALGSAGATGDRPAGDQRRAPAHRARRTGVLARRRDARQLEHRRAGGLENAPARVRLVVGAWSAYRRDALTRRSPRAHLCERRRAAMGSRDRPDNCGLEHPSKRRGIPDAGRKALSRRGSDARHADRRHPLVRGPAKSADGARALVAGRKSIHVQRLRAVLGDAAVRQRERQGPLAPPRRRTARLRPRRQDALRSHARLAHARARHGERSRALADRSPPDRDDGFLSLARRQARARSRLRRSDRLRPRERPAESGT